MSEPPNTTCPYCKASMPSDPGAYYHRKDCERRDLTRRLGEAYARNAGSDEIAQLKRELDRASYVGD